MSDELTDITPQEDEELFIPPEVKTFILNKDKYFTEMGIPSYLDGEVINYFDPEFYADEIVEGIDIINDTTVVIEIDGFKYHLFLAIHNGYTHVYSICIELKPSGLKSIYRLDVPLDHPLLNMFQGEGYTTSDDILE